MCIERERERDTEPVFEAPGGGGPTAVLPLKTQGEVYHII